MENTLDLLKELTSAVGVSGDEDNIVSLLVNKLQPYGDVTVDNLKNVYCTFGEGYHFLLDAHIDEIGFVVTDITDDGFIKFDKCGGIDTRSLPASEVTIYGKKEVRGVVSTLPPHLQLDNDKSAPKLSDLSIDTGYTADELKELVSKGDRLALLRNFTPLLGRKLSASCLDDRSGVCALLLCIDRLKSLPCKITLLLSSQEEVGTRGAKVGTFAKNVDEAISVDVSFALTPGCDKADCGELSKGAMIGFSPILDKTISNKLVECAKKNDIPYQCEIMSGRTGTNADVISISESGVKTALISIPEKYMHQRVEVVDLKDIESVADLICTYISEKVGDVNA